MTYDPWRCLEFAVNAHFWVPKGEPILIPKDTPVWSICQHSAHLGWSAIYTKMLRNSAIETARKALLSERAQAHHRREKAKEAAS